MNYAKYDDSRLVMFSGLGSMFCSGVDLHYLLTDDRKVAARKMVDAIRWVFGLEEAEEELSVLLWLLQVVLRCFHTVCPFAPWK